VRRSLEGLYQVSVNPFGPFISRGCSAEPAVQQVAVAWSTNAHRSSTETIETSTAW